jgi:hypothetical protein
MIFSSRPFLIGFLLTLVLFLAANVLAAHVQSDCGLPAFFNLSACADDIRRAGFPLMFYEEGGFSYRHNFEIGAFVIDVVCGLGLGLLGGVAARRFWKHANQV